MQTEEKVEISSGVVQGIKLHQCKLQHEDYALVGILASSKRSKVIDNVYFIKHREGGCEWFPRMQKQDIATAICQVIKDKKLIRGLVVILANDEDDTWISEWFEKMICEKGWKNEKFVYMVRNYNKLYTFKLDDITSYNPKFSRVTLQEVN
jgi:hypothetical protein